MAKNRASSLAQHAGSATAGTVPASSGGSNSGPPDYVIFALLLFFILTIAGPDVLRRTQSKLDRPYDAIESFLPAAGVLAAGWIGPLLLAYQPNYTWPGLPVYFAWRRNASV